MVYTPTTHSTMEKQTQEGLGEGDLGRARKLSHVTEEAAAQAFQSVPKAESSHTGHPWRL